MYYKNGRKFNKVDGKYIPVDGVAVVGAENPKEYLIKDDAPKPFIYGVKTIVTLVYGDKCNTYDVCTGQYNKNVSFKGRDWLDTLPGCADTIPIEVTDVVLKSSSTKQEKLDVLYSMIDDLNLMGTQRDSAIEFALTLPTLSQMVQHIEEIK